MNIIRRHGGARRALSTRCMLIAALWLGACAESPIAEDRAYDDEVVEVSQALGKGDLRTTEGAKAEEAVPQVSFSDLGKDPKEMRKVDSNGCITSASGKRVALSVDDVFEAYEPSKPSESTARLIGGGFGMRGNRGGLSAWGCWTGSCCAAGHYEAGPLGWYWVCDAYRDCERCIWPY